MKSSPSNIYCLDASALITFHRYYPRTVLPDLWAELENLFKSRKAISHELVYSEIIPKTGPADELGKWLKNLKPYFAPISSRQTQLLPDILTNFPKLIDSENKKEQADPWLIALIIEKMGANNLFEENDSYIMVSAENENSTIKIPAACRYYKIQHMNLFKFFEVNGWKLSMTKT